MSTLPVQTIDRKHGEFLIGQRVSDGYVNATAMCRACGKLVADYLRIKSTTEYLEALSADMGIPISGLAQSRKGGLPHLQGTWVHPKAAIHLAQWCSPEFAVLVSNWVFDWLTRGQRPTVVQPQLPVYVTRLSLAYLMQMSVPNGYWSVFDKSSNLLIFVECNLKLPVDRFDLLDGSIGKRWSQERHGKPWEREVKKYTHTFPDRRGSHPANAYHLDELPFFERFMRNIYIPQFLPPYLEEKYDVGMPMQVLIGQALQIGQRN